MNIKEENQGIYDRIAGSYSAESDEHKTKWLCYFVCNN